MPLARADHQQSRVLLVTEHRQRFGGSSKANPQLNLHAGDRRLCGALEQRLRISDRASALELAQPIIAVGERGRVVRHVGKDETVIKRVGKRRGQGDGDSRLIRVGDPTHN
jgi:hypothetical protein